MVGRWWFATVWVLLGSVLGCGGGDSLSIDEFQAQTLDAFCGRAIRCGQYPDRAACEGATFTRLQVISDAQMGVTRYDGKEAASCVTALRMSSCANSDLSVLSESCNKIFQGTRDSGASCFIDEECSSGNCNTASCTGTGSCCAGHCEARISLGGDCTAVGSTCVDGAFCSRSIPKICVTRIGTGQPCTGFDDCVVGALCQADAATGAMTCRTPPAQGQPCTTFCDDASDYCDPTSGTCVPRLAAGAACGASPMGCVYYADCKGTPLTCVGQSGVGGPCATSVDCIGGVFCTNGVCVAPADEPACM